MLGAARARPAHPHGGARHEPEHSRRHGPDIGVQVNKRSDVMGIRLLATTSCVAMFVVLATGGVAVATPGPIAPQDVPTSLRAWIPWVLQQSSGNTCPTLNGQDARECGWPGLLSLWLEKS